MVQPRSSITDAAELRAHTEMRLRMAAKVARFGGWSLDVASGTHFWSDELCEMLGFPAGSPPPVGVAYVLYPDEDRALIAAAMKECGERGTPFDQIRNIHDANGRLLRVRVVGEPLRKADGQISHVEGAVQDITELEDERLARVEVEERLLSTLESLTDGVMIFDSAWRYTYVNPRAQEILALDVDTVLGRVFWDLLPEEVPTAFGDAMRSAVHERKRTAARAYDALVDRWLEVTAYPTAQGAAIYIRDVTEDEAIQRDNAAKAEVIASQAALLDVAHEAIVVRGLDRTIKYLNRAAEDLYGWTAADARGRSVRELIYVDPAAFDTAMENVLRDGYWSGDIEQRRRDGRRLTAECSWTLIRDSDGVPASIFIVNTDVTTRRREENLSLRRERLESLGTLAAGVAHDLNNVLAPLLLGMQLLAGTETDPTRIALIGTMESSVKRGADLIRQVLGFASGAEGKRIAVDVGRLLSEIEIFAREVLPSDVTLTMKVPAMLWPTIGDPTQLLQVLANLVTNARDAMPHGGRLTMTAGNAELDDDYASVSHLATPGRYISIEVEDDGTGMTADVADKIFEPFFTTKEPGRGTGLGMASSLAIVRAHGGYMQVYSEPGHGSRFQLHFAAAVDEGLTVAPQHAKPIAQVPLGNGETILVVDDEEAIRQLTRQTLETSGYRTLAASNGAEALVVLAEHTGEIDLVLTDMMMPVMDGAALAAELAQSHPDLAIIATSGLNANGGVARASLAGVHHFLPKPFTAETLVRTVAAGLRGEAAADA
jgi:PAS domain S-box-containing protein